MSVRFHVVGFADRRDAAMRASYEAIEQAWRSLRETVIEEPEPVRLYRRPRFVPQCIRPLEELAA